MNESHPGGPTSASSDGGAGGFSDDVLKRALGIFKKRHKLTKLDQESKLGAHKPMTGGKKYDELGIRPPNDYPREVWVELARQGKIKDLGGGFYSLP